MRLADPSGPPERAPAHVLIVDDELLGRSEAARGLTREGLRVTEVSEPQQALEQIATSSADVALVELRVGGGQGSELIREIRRRDPSVVCLATTSFGGADASLRALGAGAFWYVEKPLDDARTLASLISRAHAQRHPGGGTARGPIVGRSRALAEALETVERVAATDATVLIRGESGVGKELIARAIHERSPRRTEALVPVNCGAIPEELLESELFGHVRGAFTNAVQTRVGRYALAQDGTLFLDEIGDMSGSLQVKLLRVLQDGHYEQVGASTSIKSNVRVIAATHQNLERAMVEGRFREDLYYRLNVVPIHVSPLRERREDIPPLIDHFLDLGVKEMGLEPPRLSDAALERLYRHDWPGNARELGNVIQRLIVLRHGDVVEAVDLPEAIGPSCPAISKGAPRLPSDGLRFQDTVRRFEAELIVQALERSRWNKAHAARLLGLNRTTLLEMIKKRGIKPGARA